MILTENLSKFIFDTTPGNNKGNNPRLKIFHDKLSPLRQLPTLNNNFPKPRIRPQIRENETQTPSHHKALELLLPNSKQHKDPSLLLKILFFLFVKEEVHSKNSMILQVTNKNI